MSAPNFNELISDIKAQPAWRALAKRCVDYYDHEQLTPKQQENLKRLEMPDIVENLIQAPINSVLGHEAQRRRDWMVEADDEDSQEVAEGLNAKLNETMRLCEANQRCSDAYAGQVKAGIGWLHVRRALFGLDNDYEIETVHRDFMFWDMRDRSLNMKDCRWMARQKFCDRDEAKALFPKEFHQLIDMVATGWSNLQDWEFVEGGFGGDGDSLYADWQGAANNIEYIIDSTRKRVAIYEVYYRVFEEIAVLHYQDGRKQELDTNNQMHLMDVMAGNAVVKKLKVSRMRQRFFIGPHQVIDRVSPYPHDYFPYVPFFGYREDQRNYPYGLIRGMIDPQDAYTNCNIRIHHILNQKRVIVSGNATEMTDSQIVSEVSRKDGVIRLKSGKHVNADILVEQDWQELYKLQELKKEHEQKIRDIAGVYQAFSGKESGGQSGVAIASLAELGAVTLAEINDNYEYARKKLAELVLAYIVHDMADQPTEIQVTEGIAQNRKRIVLNQYNEQGLNNAVALAKYQVTIAPIQSSAGYRQHQHMRLMEMYTASPDVVKMEILPMVIESSEMPRREEFLKKWNEKNGVIDDPEKQQAQAEAMAEKQQQEEQMVMQERQANLQLKQAQAKERASEAELNNAEAAKVLAEVEKLQVDKELQELNFKDSVVNDGREAMALRELESL